MRNSEKVILVTGGAGYIGSHVCKALKKADFLPVSYDNLETGHRYAVQWGPLVEGDLEDSKKLSQVFSSYCPLAVMHFAARATVAESVSFPEKYYRNNVLGSFFLLEEMRKSQTKYFIFSSSCSVYGNAQKLPISEKHPVNPLHPYGRSKVMVEEILKDYCQAYGFSFASLRYFNAAGADREGKVGEDHEKETHLIPLLFQAAQGIQTPFKLFGEDFDTPDGSAIRDYIHVEDLASANLKALEWLLHSSQSDVFNLGTGKGYSVKEILVQSEKILKKKIPIQNAPRRSGDPSCLFSDYQKAKKQLGWEPRYSDIETILQSAFRWHMR